MSDVTETPVQESKTPLSFSRTANVKGPSNSKRLYDRKAVIGALKGIDQKKLEEILVKSLDRAHQQANAKSRFHTYWHSVISLVSMNTGYNAELSARLADIAIPNLMKYIDYGPKAEPEEDQVLKLVAMTFMPAVRNLVLRLDSQGSDANKEKFWYETFVRRGPTSPTNAFGDRAALLETCLFKNPQACNEVEFPYLTSAPKGKESQE